MSTDPECTDRYERTVAADAAVPAAPGPTRRLVGDLSRWPDWLALHAGWRGTPPSGAVAGVTFGERLTLMGIPVDVSWEVTDVTEDRVELQGSGPMQLALGLSVAVAADGEGSRVRVEAGVGGDPVSGPMGATVLKSLEEAVTDSVQRLAGLLAAPQDDTDPQDEDAAAAPVRHTRTGRLLDPRTPVIVGVGQVVRRTPDLEHPADPATLAAEATRAAEGDSGGALLGRLDEIHAVASASWNYRDLGRAVAGKLGTDPGHTVMSARYGGDAGHVLLAAAGQSIAEGSASVALVCGAEAGNTLAAAQKAGVDTGWPEQPDDVRPDEVLGSEKAPNNAAETAAGLSIPVPHYALMESALRARAGATPEEHTRYLARLWSRFSEIAAGNEHAWLPEVFGAERLATPDPDNRMVSSPYPKLLCANLQVDMAAAVLVTSVAAAQEAGIPQDRWVFPHAAAAAHDEWFFSERGDLAASPAIRGIGAAALEHAGLSMDDVRHVDLYSCFPAAVQIAATELGLPLDDPERPLSVTGGLTFGGGPGNNYGTHAVATLVPRLRADPTGYGLSTSLGWYATKHALGIFSAQPPERPYRSLRPALAPSPSRPALESYAGPGVLEACTVQYRRDGSASGAILSVLTPDGARALVRSRQQDVVDAAAHDDLLGLPVEVTDPATLRITGRAPGPLPEPPAMPVLLEKRGPVAVITLNRPERRNAIDPRTAELLEQIVDHVEADPSLRIAVITGAGGSFCAGMDLKAAAAGGVAITERGGPLGITARPMTTPLIAAVEGHALAGGFELALVADLVVASTESQFGLPEPKRGLVAAAGGVLRSAQRLPRNLAMELALTGSPVPAARMAEFGLVNRLAAPGEVLDTALALAGEIAANAPLSVRVSKQIIEESPDWSVAEAFARQSELATVAVQSRDAAEGVTAFAEKRDPVWTGH